MITSWDDIREFYEDLVKNGLKLEAMLKLIDNIKSSVYADSLYAWTSMHDLCIVQTPVTYPYDGPYLRISPLFNGNVEFRYIDTHVKTKQWSRMFDENNLYAKLMSFTDQLHWLVKDKRLNDS